MDRGEAGALPGGEQKFAAEGAGRLVSCLPFLSKVWARSTADHQRVGCGKRLEDFEVDITGFGNPGFRTRFW